MGCENMSLKKYTLDDFSIDNKLDDLRVFKPVEIELATDFSVKLRIMKAAFAINSVCYGADKLDGEGFSSFHTRFFKAWLRHYPTPEYAAKNLREDIIFKMRKFLKTYEGQLLENHGIVYSDLFARRGI
jgi:hypothetical protein